MYYKTGAMLLMLLSSSLVSTSLIAQNKQVKKEKTEKTEKTKATSKEKTTIVIDGDEITVNGKPISEYDGDNIVIRKRNREVEVHGYAYGSPRVHVSPRVSIAPTPPMNYNYNFSWDDHPNTRTIYSSRAQLGVTTEKDKKGVKVTDVIDESAAAKAGIKEGDIISTVDGEKIVDADDLYEAISEKKPGQEVTVGYIRGSKSSTQKVKLGEQKIATTKSSGPSYFKSPQPFAYGGSDIAVTAPRIRSDVGGYNFYSSTPKLGVRIEDTDAGDGVRVLYVEEGSIAEKSGIKENDLITNIDSVEIKDTNRARNALMEAGEKQSFVIVVKRNGSPMNLQVKIPKRLNKTDL